MDVRGRRGEASPRGHAHPGGRRRASWGTQTVLHQQVRLLHRPQMDRDPVRVHGPLLPALRLQPDVADAVAARMAGPRVQPHESPRREPRPWRSAAPRGVQPARRDARDDHGLPRDRAARRRRVRQLPRPADDRRSRHGLPAAQHGELLDVPAGRPGDARQLCGHRWHRAVGVDVVSASL